MNGKLQCPLEVLATLSSYWLQSEFGDEDDQSNEVKEYLSSLKYIPGADKLTHDFEKKVEKLYKMRRGMPSGILSFFLCLKSVSFVLSDLENFARSKLFKP